MVNIPLMYEPISKMYLGADCDASILQQIFDSFITFFFKGKFYLIFSLLFGYGFWLFMNKKSETGQRIVPVFSRRLFFLFLFGVAHVVLLWAGDILVVYALYGFLLLLFRKSSNRKMMRWAIVFVLIPVVFTVFGILSIQSAKFAPPEMQEQITANIDAAFEQQIQGYQQIVDKANITYSSGSYVEMMKMRLLEYRLISPAFLFAYPIVLAMFLLGAIIAKKEYLSNHQNHISKIRKAFWWTLIIGVLTNVLYLYYNRIAFLSIPSFPGLWMLITSTVGGIAFAFCYACGIILLYTKGKCTKTFHLMASTGRMALSNYLGQSLICAVLMFCFGWFGKLVLWQSVLLTIAIFVSQMFFSRWWLSKFYFGPMEWLWRCLTYWKKQPFLKG